MTNRRNLAFVFFFICAFELNAQEKMSLDETKTAIDFYKKRVRTEDQVVNIIESRGVAYFATQDNLDELTRAGATKLILDTIRRIARVPAGSLEVRCVPAECDLAINGRPAGKSVKGVFHLQNVAVGNLVVDVSRDGYISQQKLLTIVPNVSAEATIKLEPTVATKNAIGKRLFDAVLAALAATPRTAGVAKFSGNGGATAFAADKQSEWMIAVEGSSSVMTMRVASPAGTLEYTCAGQTCESGKGKSFFRLKGAKSLPAPVSDELQIDLRAYSRFNYLGLLRSWMSPAIKFSAAEPDGTETGERHLYADAGDLIYDIAIGSDLHPIAISYVSQAGLGSGLKITFGQYQALSNGLQYPMRTAVSLADSEKHGIEVRFDKVELANPPDVPKN
jgi:hypothetical protein